MFDKFGEFDSAEELNQAAAGQKEQGDLDALMLLAEENGIEKEYACAYMDGVTDALSDCMSAAAGKLDVEIMAAGEGLKDTLEAMGGYLKAHCTEETLARGIRRKGKSLKGAYEEIRKEAEKRVKKRSGEACVPMPPGEVYRMLREYYTGKKGKS